jgi:signal transduction histidine kinase
VTLALAKAAGFVNVGAGLTADQVEMRSFAGCLVLAVALIPTGVAVVVASARSGRVRPGWVSADLLVIVTALVVNAQLLKPGLQPGWAYFTYPYSLVSLVGVEIAYRRPAIAVGATALLPCGYLAGYLTIPGRGWDGVPNALSYLGLAPVLWFVVRELNDSAQALDGERSRAEELARDRERARHFRILHDRVLQTFDVLLRGDLVNGHELRAMLSTESAWLRHLIETGDERTSTDLVSSLDAVAARLRLRGLKVEVNAAGLAGASSAHRRLSREQTAALADAAAEALTNSLKHAAVDRAVVRAVVEGDHVVVSVTDSGKGFDPASLTRVSGLEQSITRRLAAVGGSVSVDTAPGAGTCVLLSVPVTV